MNIHNFHQLLKETAITKYIAREDLHKYLKQRPDGSEYSPVINLFTSSIIQAVKDRDKKYFTGYKMKNKNGDTIYINLFEEDCEVLCLDSDKVMYWIEKFWKCADA